MEKPIWVTDLGNFNLLPKPYRRISSHEFWHNWGAHRIEEIEYRQVFLEEISKYQRSLHIFWYSDSAFAIMPPIHWHPGKDEYARKGIIYEDQPIFFRIGCDHIYVQTGGRMHFNEFKCELCGWEFSVDSSG